MRPDGLQASPLSRLLSFLCRSATLPCIWPRRLESHQRLPGFNRALCSLSYRASMLEPTGGLEPPSPGYEAGALPVELYRRWLRGQASNLQALAGAGLTTRCVCLFRHHGSLWQRVEESNPCSSRCTPAFEASCRPSGGTLCVLSSPSCLVPAAGFEPAASAFAERRSVL